MEKSLIQSKLGKSTALTEISNIANKEISNRKIIKKIVITGGPCGGKSTALTEIEVALTQAGWALFVLSEAATYFINSGIRPQKYGLTDYDFQLSLLKHQIEKENMFEEIAKKIPADKVLIICDRGALDGKAYCSEDDFYKLLSEVGISEISLRDEYDAVFHLKTAADGAEDFYTLANNTARTETIEEARILDRKTINAWTGHPHLRVIDNSTDFDGKINRVVSEIFKVLGEPVPIEISLKFLVNMPNIQELTKNVSAERVEIISTYLKKDNESEEKRIRQRGSNGNYIYSLTTKKTVSSKSTIKTEQRISEREYLSFLRSADTSLRPIIKERYCFIHKNRYFELDVYPFWEDKAILEIKLTEESESIEIPDFITIIKEVSEDFAYRNVSIAKTIPC